MLAYRGAVLLRRPPKIEQEEDLLLPKRKIQLKENDDSHLQFLGCDSEMAGYKRQPGNNDANRVCRD